MTTANKRIADETAPLKPPLKWAGGKRWLVATLAPAWRQHAHRRLVEPFCGGMAMTFGLEPANALLSDINPHTINFFECLRAGLQIDMPMENDETLYYQHRERFNALISDQGPTGNEAAGLFYYLNRTGFNGLCRFNRKGRYNVPFGRHRTINYRRDFSAYQPRLQPWTFRLSDFSNLALEPGDFVYADPPYDVEFTDYSANGFDWEDQQRLARHLSAHPGPVILSNQATDRVVKLYQDEGFELRFTLAPRFISRDGNRTPAAEVLAIRNLNPELLPDARIQRPSTPRSKS